jgi:hypothetical protein
MSLIDENIKENVLRGRATDHQFAERLREYNLDMAVGDVLRRISPGEVPDRLRGRIRPGDMLPELPAPPVEYPNREAMAKLLEQSFKICCDLARELQK